MRSRDDALLELANISLQTSGPLFEADRHKDAGRLKEACATYARLEDLLERQLALTEEFNARFDPPHMDVAPIAGSLVNALSTHASLEGRLGREGKKRALDAREEVLATRYLPRGDRADRKLNLAGLRAAQNRYHEAISLLSEARDLLEDGDDRLASAEVSSRLADILEWLGDLGRAREEAAHATALLDPLVPMVPTPTLTEMLQVPGDLEGLARRMRSTGIWLRLMQLDARSSRELGDLDRATQLFADIRTRVPSAAGPAIDFHLARIEIQAGRNVEGLQMLDALRPFFVDDGLLRTKLGVLEAWRARALLALRRPLDALEAATDAVSDLARHADDDSLWRAQRTRAHVLLGLDRRFDARLQLRDAVATISRLRRGSLGYRLDSTFLADKLPMIEEAIDLAVESGDAPEACRLIELVKARGLTAILSVPRADTIPSDAFEAISRELDDLELRASRERDDASTEELRVRRSQLLRKRSALIERARIVDPRWRTLAQPPQFEPAALSATLDRSVAALALYVTGGKVFAVVIDESGCHAAMKPLEPSTIASLDRYRDSLSADRPPLDPATLDDLDLDDLVPAAVLERALRAGSVAISPHGFLNLIPWPMLRWRGARLFQHRPSSVIPNLSCLALVPAHDGACPAIALIGSPEYGDGGPRYLLMASDELRDIADTHGEARVLGRIVEGRAATEAAFCELAARPDAGGATLHVCCHGDFVAEEPLYSGLLLRDGKVDASEIARMRLAYHEVVLSTCSSGHRATAVDGIPLTGDDVVGLVGAFLEAGVRAVVVSITRARDDASHAFMTTYHSHRAAGSTPVAALRETQLQMLEDATYAPGLWAGFVVYGS